MDGSDFEQFCSEGEDNDWEEVHCWYGKLDFTLRLGKAIVRDAKPGTTRDQLDFELMRRMTAFPYSARLQETHDKNTSRERDEKASSSEQPFNRFVSAIGALANSEDQKSEQAINRLVSGQDGVAPIEDTLAQVAEFDEQTVPEPEHNTSMPSPSTEDPLRFDTNIAKYTTALKEYGDGCRCMPIYQIEPIELNPPRFTAEVTIRSLTFKGTANTKKHAKHLASRRACQAIGIVI